MDPGQLLMLTSVLACGVERQIQRCNASLQVVSSQQLTWLAPVVQNCAGVCDWCLHHTSTMGYVMFGTPRALAQTSGAADEVSITVFTAALLVRTCCLDSAANPSWPPYSADTHAGAAWLPIITLLLSLPAMPSASHSSQRIGAMLSCVYLLRFSGDW